ncbi:MAG: radical SAM family heme chaperone HemW [Lentisphaerae bacterium]|nr:radical SAM family heme chaperone HemW [Lentisphaerota bacterium]
MSPVMFDSLYIHVPFCAGKCAYCAFYSLGASTPEQRRSYLNTLAAECRRQAPRCQPLQTIFVGGGTPSLLSPEELGDFLAIVRDHFAFAANCEWTVEANPESLTPAKIAMLAAAGVNRLSIGIQSFKTHLRERIGRRGSLNQLPTIMQTARDSGIRRINFDLIFAIPGQTLADWQEDLAQALSWQPSHLSTYALTVEETTPLAQSMKNDQYDDDFVAFWDACDETLGKQGLHRYEIANFARPGHECRHNLRIWHGASYLGCGPAATSFDGQDRWTNPAHLQQWLNGQAPELDRINPDARAAEILAFGMRCVAGWQWEDFRRRCRRDPLELRGDALRRLAKLGLITLDADGARPTRQGLLFNDDLVAELL